MSRREAPQIESAGSDSFLDVVTNIVGILIILVMVVGDRARHTIFPVADAKPKADVALEAARGTAADVERDVNRLSRETNTVETELLIRKQEREVVATVISAAEKDIASRRAALDDKSRKQYDLACELALAKASLEKLELERVRLDQIVPTNLKIESYPTPLSKPVDGKELHLQLRRNRVTIVPVDELVDRLKSTAREKVGRLQDAHEYTDTIGPIDGFRMRYTIERIDLGTLEPGRGGSYVQLSHWELLPVASDLGEPIAEALGPQSRLRAKIDQIKPREWTVTLWVYSDSFDAFRQLRKEFYQLGYHVAGRPLPDGFPIGGSPQGTKSAAQ